MSVMMIREQAWNKTGSLRPTCSFPSRCGRWPICARSAYFSSSPRSCTSAAPASGSAHRLTRRPDHPHARDPPRRTTVRSHQPSRDADSTGEQLRDRNTPAYEQLGEPSTTLATPRRDRRNTTDRCLLANVLRPTMGPDRRAVRVPPPSLQGRVHHHQHQSQLPPPTSGPGARLLAVRLPARSARRRNRADPLPEPRVLLVARHHQARRPRHRVRRGPRRTRRIGRLGVHAS